MPLGKRGPGGLDRCVNVGGRSLGYGGEFLAGRRVGRVEVLASGWFHPRAVDEVAEAALMMIEPRERLFGILRGWAVLHGDEFFGDAHSSDSLLKTMQSDDDNWRNSVR